MTAPETRPSLLIRVRDHEDRDAWDEFAQIYRPVIMRLAHIRGLQSADAEDLAQRVLMAVARAIPNWEPDPVRAKFRTWLRTIADNAILNALTRGLPDHASGDDDMRLLLEKRPANDGPESGLLQVEFRREVFARAAQQIRGEFSDDTWMSFWLTAVDGLEIEAAAEQLGRTRGSVYASRSRVIKRLKRAVDEFCSEIEE